MEEEQKQAPYTKEWSDYGWYEKEEYDVRLHDGTEHYSLYPNAGKFSDVKGNQIPEEKVAQIRLTHFPKWYINDGDNWPASSTLTSSFARLESNYEAEVNIDELDGDYWTYYMPAKQHMLDFEHNTLPKELRGKPVLEVKPRNKNGRNNFCTCGSGLKQKRCCK
jgi:hypothetical protein